MTELNQYHLSFEIECHKLVDLSEFCRVFFRPASVFPPHLLFGLDHNTFDPYEIFREKHAGMVVNRYDKLNIFMKNTVTGFLQQLDIDLEPLWPSVENPSDVKTRLSSLDISKAIWPLI